MIHLMGSRSSSAFRFLILAILFSACIVPFVARAQSSDADLNATIRAAITSDPRSQGMTEAQLEALVVALTKQASEQGVTAQDIQWRPLSAEDFAASNAGTTNTCSGLPAFFCSIDEAFGLSGPYGFIAITLGLTSAVLLFVIGMFLHRHGHHVTGAFVAPTP